MPKYSDLLIMARRSGKSVRHVYKELTAPAVDDSVSEPQPVVADPENESVEVSPKSEAVETPAAEAE